MESVCRFGASGVMVADMDFNRKEIVSILLPIVVGSIGYFLENLLMLALMLIASAVFGCWLFVQHPGQSKSCKAAGCTVIILVSIVIYWQISKQIEEKILREPHGLLEPASDKLADGPCVKTGIDNLKYWSTSKDIDTQPIKDMIFKLRKYPVLNWNSLWVSLDVPENSIIKIRGRSVFSISKDKNDNIEISVDLFDANGDLVMRINHNVIDIVTQKVSIFSRPDRSTVILFDRKGDEEMRIRYKNRHQVEISGTMYFDGSPLYAKDNSFIYRGQQSHISGCMDGGSVLSFQ